MNAKARTLTLSDGKNWWGTKGDTGRLILTQSMPDEGMLDAVDATLVANLSGLAPLQP